jgi:DNA helicase-2/ATP-dependent DNA helicase PcrA
VQALDTSLEGLNPAQRAAVMHGEGPLLVLAGAGSGKTRVVTLRMARLIRDGVAPQDILALTFTNKAAAEMRARCLAVLGADATAATPTVSTFHAFGARFLRSHAPRFGRTASFSLFDDDDQIALLKRALATLGLGERASEARGVREAIDAAKNGGRAVSPADLPPEILAAGGARIAEVYETLLARANAFDFGDLIVRPAELLSADPALAAAVRRRHPWILVDEFQDTNAAQLAWLEALAPPDARPNLCVVGDDDQSIYGWRGADVDNILGFARHWPAATVVRLEQNYRSTGHILDAANAVVAHNRARLGKTLFTADGAGEPLEVRDFASPRDEARWVATRIAELCRNEGVSPADVAILLRTNALSLDLEESLRAARLPAVMLRGRSFYERAEVRDALAWLRLVVNPDDDVAFRRAIGAPPRGVGDTTLERMVTAAHAAHRSLFALLRGNEAPPLKGAAVEGMRDFLSRLSVARDELEHGVTPERVALHLLTPLCDRLRGEALRRSGGEDARARLENVERLVAALHAYRRERPGATLGEWLESVRLVSDADELDTAGGAVSLLTVHAAKGLEFPVCFVVGLEEGSFPHRRGEGSEADTEEERRLFYVALTRARRHLALTWCRERRTFAEVRRAPPSRFLAELPASAIAPHVEPVRHEPPRARFGRTLPRSDDALFRDDVYDDHGSGADPGFRPGASVWHGDLGRGRIVSLGRGANAATATVDFPSIGRRVIVLSYLSLYEDSGGDWHD